MPHVFQLALRISTGCSEALTDFNLPMTKLLMCWRIIIIVFKSSSTEMALPVVVCTGRAQDSLPYPVRRMRGSGNTVLCIAGELEGLERKPFTYCCCCCCCRGTEKTSSQSTHPSVNPMKSRRRRRLPALFVCVDLHRVAEDGQVSHSLRL